MASAVKKPKDDYEVVLTLNPEEARYLGRVVANVIGRGRLREVNEEISRALLPWWDGDDQGANPFTYHAVELREE